MMMSYDADGGSCWWQVILRVVMNVSCAVVVELAVGDGL